LVIPSFSWSLSSEHPVRLYVAFTLVILLSSCAGRVPRCSPHGPATIGNEFAMILRGQTDRLADVQECLTILSFSEHITCKLPRTVTPTSRQHNAQMSVFAVA
jgi:hypothetical protein